MYDIEKCFDALWLEDCLNDMHDTLPEDQHDDKLALVYESNRNNLVAVKTAVGMTDRINMEKIVTQGGTFGPIECANSIDKIGQKCYNKGEHIFWYKKMVPLIPLSFVDDLLTMSKCGTESLEMNTYITAQIETKKLRFHTPDINGKSKCHFLHIGKTSKTCPEHQVHGTKMQKVSEETYLGDIISEDGKNTKNLKQKISKGLGIISQIMNILENVTLGEHFFTTAVLLRESMFLNGILTNVEVLYGLKKSEIEQLEELDKNLLRQILSTPISTPSESLFLELGCLDIETVIKSRRINYLHYLVTRKESEMVKKFFLIQWKYPTNKQEWTEQVKTDLLDFQIPVDIEFIQTKSKNSFKNLVKIKAKEYCFFKLMTMKIKHTKMDNLFYSELRMQPYLKSNLFTAEQAKMIYSFRTRMSNFKENYRGSQGHSPCPLCLVHLDSQAAAFQCPKLKQEINVKGNLDKIFSDEIPLDLVITLTNILEYRQDNEK